MRARTRRPAADRIFTSFWIIIAAGFVALLAAPGAALAGDPPPEAGSPPAPGLVRLSEMNEGALLLRTEHQGRYLPAPMVATDVDIEISGSLVRAVITQRFENPSEAWVEGVYVHPLPDMAGVDRLRMLIGDRVIEGEIHERVQARRIYEQARADGRRAGLVEQERPNLFTTSVANIGPGETVIVQIEYQDVARFRDGRYEMRLPLGLTPRYIPESGPLRTVSSRPQASAAPSDAHRITPPIMPPSGEPGESLRLPVSISVELQAGFRLGEVASLYHAIQTHRSEPGAARLSLADGPVPANRDFVLVWRPADAQAPSAALFTEEWNGATYLLAQITPPAALGGEAPRRERETIFVIDNSGSMAGTSMDQARAALIAAIERLEPGDRFNVIRFDDSWEQVFPQAVEASERHKTRALRFARDLRAGGGTEMLPALRAALRDHAPADERVRQIVFMTDGAIGNEDQLFAAIEQGLGRSRLFPVGIGSAPNSYFMSRAARLGRGTFTHIGQVNEVETAMAQLFTALERPVMTDLDALFAAGALEHISPSPLPDLYFGEPVLLTARLNQRDGPMVIEGRLAGAVWREEFALEEAQPAAGVAALWARHHIAGLEESRFRGVHPADIDRQVLQTALDFRLVSRRSGAVRPERVDGRQGRARPDPARPRLGARPDRSGGAAPLALGRYLADRASHRSGAGRKRRRPGRGGWRSPRLRPRPPRRHAGPGRSRGERDRRPSRYAFHLPAGA